MTYMKPLSRAIAILTSGVALTTLTPVALAESKEIIEEVMVTGSSIKRVALDGSLPVTVIDREDIDSLGISSTAELIQQIPAMQGFTTTADSVGGGGGGITTASLRDLGESYTLTLLNGRRLAPATSGSTVNLNTIPLAAVERVDVLTDGAGALYGSDAIAGVLNFMLKRDVQETTVSFRKSIPQEDGGESLNGSITTGFGDLSTDGYNVLLSYSHDEQDQLKATDRDFSKSGIISFSDNGRDLFFFNGSGNAIPGNARVKYKNGVDEDGKDKIETIVFNPYRETNGSCAENTSLFKTECWFDYTTTIEIQPEKESDSIFLAGNLQINDDLLAYTNLNYSKIAMTTRIAPYPTGWVRLPNDASLVSQYVLPHLTDEQKDNITSVDGRWRALPAGNRTTEWDTTAINFVIGAEGDFAGIDFNTGFTYSTNEADQNYTAGHLLGGPFKDAVGSGSIDIFAPAGTDIPGIDELVFKGTYESTTTELVAFDITGSKEVFSLPAGPAYLGAGFDVRQYTYEHTISDASRDRDILFRGAGTAYDLQRQNYGAFAELILPVIEDLEITASARFDDIGDVDDSLQGVTLNSGGSDVTYKLSARYQLNEEVIFRASVGSGFKAPSLLSLARPRSDFGVTGGNYPCPFTSGDPLAEYCLSGNSQYAQFRQGNADIKPELSKQINLGVVLKPSENFSAELTYWSIDLSDQVSGLTESQIFEDAERYRNLFTTRLNTATGEDELAILVSSVNIGRSNNAGIDWSFVLDNDFSFGQLSTRWSGTYMLESEYTRPGTTDDYISSLGRFGDNNSVTFRVVSQLSTTLAHDGFTGDDSFSHTLTANFKSGYADEFHSVENCSVKIKDSKGDCASAQRTISAYTKLDFQTQYKYNDSTRITFGINNLLDKQPDLSLRSGGAGHQVGFDPRYVDVYGRTLYLSADYTF